MLLPVQRVERAIASCFVVQQAVRILREQLVQGVTRQRLVVFISAENGFQWSRSGGSCSWAEAAGRDEHPRHFLHQLAAAFATISQQQGFLSFL
jgi:hypothetical protein